MIDYFLFLYIENNRKIHYFGTHFRNIYCCHFFNFFFAIWVLNNFLIISSIILNFICMKKIKSYRLRLNIFIFANFFHNDYDTFKIY